MILFRYIGYGLCASSVLILIFEIIRYLETYTINLITLKQAVQNRFEGSLNRSGSDSYFSGFLGDIVVMVINMPLITVVIVTGVILIYLTRHCDG